MSKRETAASRSALAVSEAPHMGLVAADTKGQSSRRGRVGEDECEREEHWSSGCMGLEAAGEEREKDTKGRAESGSRHGARFAKKEASKENKMD